MAVLTLSWSLEVCIVYTMQLISIIRKYVYMYIYIHIYMKYSGEELVSRCSISYLLEPVYW